MPFSLSWRPLASALLLALAVAQGACSSVHPWRNGPLGADTSLEPIHTAQAALERDPTILVAVTLSGGGARAAAFGYGVLSELAATRFTWNGRQTDLLNATDVISGVSGGSIVAAYFAAFGEAGLRDFENDFLRQNFQNSLIAQTLRPANLLDLSSPWFGRSDLLARRLDLLYHGLTYGDIEKRPRHPQLVITATDMSLGTGFEFTADQFALLCSDFASVPLSFAVAASSAVPLLLSPVTLKNYSSECARTDLPQRLPGGPAGDIGDAGYRTRLYLAHQRSYLDGRARPYIHLVDGGLSDNLGVRRLLDRALAGGSLRASFGEVQILKGSIRKLVMIVVNAERDPFGGIDGSDRVPSIGEVIDTVAFGVNSRTTHETQGFLNDLAAQWRREIAVAAGGFDAFALDAEIHVVQVNLRDTLDPALRRSLLRVPTAFSVSATEVDQLIAAGHDVLQRSAAFQALIRSLPDAVAAP